MAILEEPFVAEKSIRVILTYCSVFIVIYCGPHAVYPVNYAISLGANYSGSIFTNRVDIWTSDLVKFRNPKIGYYKDRIALKFDRLSESDAAEVPVKFQSHREKSKPESRDFDTPQDFAVRRPST